MEENKVVRYAWGSTALIILALVFLFQKFNYFSFLTGLISQHPREGNPYVVLMVNKTIRLIINDLACLLIILAIFKQKKYIQVAFYVFLFEVIILLPVYFLIKLSIEGDSEISSPLLSMVHRLIINPTLMILLMVSFFYQKYRA